MLIYSSMKTLGTSVLHYSSSNPTYISDTHVRAVSEVYELYEIWIIRFYILIQISEALGYRYQKHSCDRLFHEDVLYGKVQFKALKWLMRNYLCYKTLYHYINNSVHEVCTSTAPNTQIIKPYCKTFSPTFIEK